MPLSASILARIEAMIDRGQVFSEPASLSGTDRMLDALSAPQSRGTSGPSAAAASRRHGSNWLDLPSLSELLEMRRILVLQHRDWPMLESDTGPEES